MTQDPYSVIVGSRSYLMENDNDYNLYRMLEKVLSLDVEMSDMPCGINSAINFSEMENTGSMSPTNTAVPHMELVTVSDSVHATSSE